MLSDAEYCYVKEKVFGLTQIDLDCYKEKQMRRRFNGLLDRVGVPDATTYFNRVEQDNKMLTELRDFLTINVSCFFRDDNHFDRLRTIILPQLLRNSCRLNIWSAGCSNGSEPYTLAILLSELSPGNQHRILATDIDEKIIGRAQAGGPYTPADVKSVPQSLLRKYFEENGGGYHVVEDIKKRVMFRRHNLLSDPYETGFDLIVCRNVVIYFTDAAKRKINQGFFESLKPEGILFIGGSEIIFEADRLGFKSLFPSFYRKPAGMNLVNKL